MAFNRPLQITALLSFLAVGVTTAAAKDPKAADVGHRVAELANAFRVADLQRLDALIAPRYVHTNGGSEPLTRDQWFSYIVARHQELASGALQLTRYENRDIKIIVQRDVAIVTGVNFSEGLRQGTPFSRMLRFTQVWRLGPTGWQRVAFQDAEIAP